MIGLAFLQLLIAAVNVPGALEGNTVSVAAVAFCCGVAFAHIGMWLGSKA